MKERYKLIFVPVQSKSKVVEAIVKTKSFENFENIIIRIITFVTMDPFE